MQIDREVLAARLLVLAPAKRTAFAASCAERLLPNYEHFARDAGWGNYALLRHALDTVWSRLLAGELEPADTRRLADACFEQAPDTEEFTSELTSAALDAANSVGAAVECLLHLENLDAAVDAGIAARDTVDMFAAESEDLDPNRPDYESRILKHPLVAAEIQRQMEDLAILDGETILTRELLDALRARSWNRGASNIGVTMTSE